MINEEESMIVLIAIIGIIVLIVAVVPIDKSICVISDGEVVSEQEADPRQSCVRILQQEMIDDEKIHRLCKAIINQSPLTSF